MRWTGSHNEGVPKVESSVDGRSSVNNSKADLVRIEIAATIGMLSIIAKLLVMRIFSEDVKILHTDLIRIAPFLKIRGKTRCCSRSKDHLMIKSVCGRNVICNFGHSLQLSN